MGILWKSYWNFMEILWNFYGIFMGFLWNFLWEFYWADDSSQCRIFRQIVRLTIVLFV